MSMRILEVFVRLQSMLLENTELRLAIEKLERKTDKNFTDYSHETRSLAAVFVLCLQTIH